MAYRRSMRDLYERLKNRGFDAKFVRDVVLPDWWEDALADNPANRAIAEVAIARHLGFPMKDLARPNAQLTMPAVSDFRLKGGHGTTPAEVRPAVMVAQRVAALILEAARALPPFRSGLSALEARRAILERSAFVDLRSLVDFAWEHGIALAHLDRKRMPRLTKKFDGVAMFLGAAPVVVLCSGRDSPPWLAFHLAHEMGHLFCGHVEAGSKPLVDSNMDKAAPGRQEEQSDEFATQLLTGEKTLSFRPEYGLTGDKLRSSAEQYGRRNAIDPASVALIYGRSADRWAVAQKALKLLRQDEGAQEIINRALLGHLHVDDLPESTLNFLRCLSAVHL